MFITLLYLSIHRLLHGISTSVTKRFLGLVNGLTSLEIGTSLRTLLNWGHTYYQIHCLRRETLGMLEVDLDCVTVVVPIQMEYFAWLICV